MTLHMALNARCSAGRPAVPTTRPAAAAALRPTALCRGSSTRDSAPHTPDLHPLRQAAAIAASSLASLTLLASGASARLEGVSRPDLLPAEYTTVIDVAGFLTPSEEKKIQLEVESLERDTGYKLRVLAQSYPETPGLAVRDYWKVDDTSIVFVADPTFRNILNFNVGQTVDLDVPQSFWTRLAGKYGNKFYWQEKGEATAILDAVSAVDTCLREPAGRFKCSQVQGELGEEPSSGPFGKFFS